MVTRASKVRWLIVLVSFVLTWCGATHAADGDVRNAAHWYDQVIEDVQSLSDEQLIAIQAYAGEGGEPTPEVRALLRSVEPTLSLLRRGASQQYSDYGLDYSQGFDLRLPHLRDMRTAAKLMNAQVKLKMHDGDVNGAARDLASMYRMGGHMGDDRTIISGLVGHAIFAYGDETVQDAIDRGAIDSEAAAELVKGVQFLDENDPFGYVESIFTEQQLMTSTLRETLQSEGGADELAEMLMVPVDAGGDVSEQLRSIDLDQEMAKLDSAMNEVAEVFMLTDEDEARRRMDELDAAIENGEYGMFVSLVMPAYDKVYDRMLEAREMIAERQAVLEKLASGELDPMELANAAIICKRAMDAFDELDEPQRLAIIDLADEPSQQVSEEMKSALDAAQPVIDLLRKGSTLRRCDFEPLRRNDDRAIAPEYVVGMHELLKLLQADVVRLARAKDSESAADRLAIGYRVVGHLGLDDMLVSALVAHDAFDHFTAQVRGGLSVGLFEDEKPLLNEAVQRIARRDPFGYINAVMETRKELPKRIRTYVTDPPEEYDWEVIDEQVQQWQGDELLYVLAVLHYADEQRAREQRIKAAAKKAGGGAGEAAVEEIISERPALIEQLAPLGDVLSLEAIDAAQRDVPRVLHQLRTADLEIMDREQMP